MKETALSVLVVEDELLLAMDIEAMVEDCGHCVVAEAMSLAEVEALPDSLAPHLAFVDVQLAQGSSGIDVSALIQKRWRDTIIVFVTANPKKIPADFAGAHGVVPKPFSRNGLSSVIHYIEEGIFDPPPADDAPTSLIAAPALVARFS